jgi:hypothetical protein
MSEKNCEVELVFIKFIHYNKTYMVSAIINSLIILLTLMFSFSVTDYIGYYEYLVMVHQWAGDLQIEGSSLVTVRN